MQEDWKRAAAEAAAALAEDGMVVGLGTGSTAAWAIAALGERVRRGLRILGIPTSERSAAQARTLGIPLTGFDRHARLDLAIDGADEVEPGTLDLVKGLGGALLREKIVAAASARLVIAVDEGKLVARLGSRAPVPVEVVDFGREATAAHLAALGAEPALRRGEDGVAFRSDGGNPILDCRFGPIGDAGALETALNRIPGVIENGLFVGRAAAVAVGGAGGVRWLRRQG
ncbi:ribose-5-phosphate isomerase RpiA [Roseomonas sp. NAR14]|uniref:Ribose-5-phosphate isomerase A n=1 Tax=Roseomonas acroporae TaxID=2937791 RepID=A0A9X1Y5U0_9PROT|nr:ribose-5-phosphate isomerase RpiA [Roseomonas acroporae]MCK8783595.1 ribose-5-phosphate isomerase RpiA [Roseomonas acroporae]